MYCYAALFFKVVIFALVAYSSYVAKLTKILYFTKSICDMKGRLKF